MQDGHEIYPGSGKKKALRPAGEEIFVILHLSARSRGYKRGVAREFGWVTSEWEREFVPKSLSVVCCSVCVSLFWTEPPGPLL